MELRQGRERADCRFLAIPGTGEIPEAWLQSQRALGSLIRRCWRDLAPAVRVAACIRRGLETLFPCIEDICRHTCPWCPEPCCIVTAVWYDFIDLIGLHLSQMPLPPGPLANRLGEPCRYLSPRGCRLPRRLRPWGCIQYTCATQWNHLHRHRPAEAEELGDALSGLRDLRYQLEREFRRGIEHTQSRAVQGQGRWVQPGPSEVQ